MHRSFPLLVWNNHFYFLKAFLVYSILPTHLFKTECLRPKPGHRSQLAYPHRLPELDEPDQEKPVANQDLADVIIEEIVDEQQASGGSAFVACVSKMNSSLSIFTWMFVVC